MLIFKKGSANYVFIHIPKSAGKHIRNKISGDKENQVIKSYWDCKDRLDLAHIPYMLREPFVEQNVEYSYVTYTRNPYHRIISAFFYKNPSKTKNDFKDFIKNTLRTIDFSMSFDKEIVHYYPQYLFLCNKEFQIPNHIVIHKLEDTENPKIYDLMDFYEDEEYIRIVNEVYEKDFTLLGYEPITITTTSSTTTTTTITKTTTTTTSYAFVTTTKNSL